MGNVDTEKNNDTKVEKKNEKKICDPNDFRIELVKKDNLDIYVELYRKYFVPREPLGLGLHLGIDEGTAFIKDCLTEWISSGASVCVVYVPTDEVVGALFTKILSRSDRETFEASDISHYSSEVQGLIKILNYLENYYNMFEDENVEKILEIGATTVNPRFAGNKLVNRMTEECEKLGRELGCQLATAQSTNKITQHIRRKMGFEECFTMEYKDIEIEGVKPLDVDAMDNGTTCATVFKKYLK